MEKRILGLDPGLASLGFGCIKITADRCIQVEDFGIIQTPAGTEVGDRLQIIHKDLHCVIERAQPHLVAIEKFFFYRMSNTILVAQARGVILLTLAEYQLPLVEFTPAQIKQALTGYGNAVKLEVQEAVRRELNLAVLPKPDDAADALAVALTAWFQL